MTSPYIVPDVERRIGYHFRNPSLLSTALTHASAVDATWPRAGERLEFLGDAVLGLIMADLLIARYPHHDEGRLSKYRAALVSTASFAGKARELELHRALMLGKGEEKTGGREKASILAAVYEAVIGALFAESGYAGAKQIVARHFADAVDQIGRLSTTDAKTELQELCQQTYRTTPTYRVVRAEGPDHARRFVVDVVIGVAVVARGEGNSKRAAEQAAAQHALQLSSMQTFGPDYSTT